LVSGRNRSWASRLALGTLVLATSLAVASYASVWLVVPYLALMAWLLQPSTDRRLAATAAKRWDEPAPEAEAGETLIEGPLEGWEAADLETATVPAALKSKRPRARVRKAKPAPVNEPVTQVTWMRVGPGKFVRVEGPTTLVAFPERTEETIEPPEAADVPAPEHALGPETSATAAEVTPGVEPWPEPDACAVALDVPSPAPLECPISEGPPTGSAGLALWRNLRAACPRRARVLRTASARPLTRRTPSASGLSRAAGWQRPRRASSRSPPRLKKLAVGRRVSSLAPPLRIG
jgi:hypothetical protein